MQQPLAHLYFLSMLECLLTWKTYSLSDLALATEKTTKVYSVKSSYRHKTMYVSPIAASERVQIKTNSSLAVHRKASTLASFAQRSV